MKNKKIYTVGTSPKSNRLIEEIDTKFIPLTYTYMTTHFPGATYALQ